MSEENSLLTDVPTGLGTDASPIESAETNLSFGEIVDANKKAEEEALAKLLNSKNLSDTPAEQPVEEKSEEATTEVSEESTDEETTTVESTDGDDSVTEESDDTDEFVSDDDDVQLFDNDSLKDGAFEVQWGEETKTMTWDQIQKQLDRSRSASEKSREAKEQLESIATDKEALSTREAKVEQLEMSDLQARELVIYDYQYRVLSEQMENANGEQYKALDKQRQDVANKFHEVKSSVDETKKSLFTDLSKDISDYATSKLSAQSVKAAKYDPALADIIAKAKKWDESKRKVALAKPKLKAKRSMAKGNSGGIPKSVDSKKEAAKKAIKKGNFASVDPDTFLKSYLASK